MFVKSGSKLKHNRIVVERNNTSNMPILMQKSLENATDDYDLYEGHVPGFGIWTPRLNVSYQVINSNHTTEMCRDCICLDDIIEKNTIPCAVANKCSKNSMVVGSNQCFAECNQSVRFEKTI
jgi:hypothetical protein